MPFVDGAANRASIEQCNDLVRAAAQAIGAAMSPIKDAPSRATAMEEEQ